jgi:diacylglycerol kinase (ATP)
MSGPRALVALNPAARHGTARARWNRIRGAVAERFATAVIETSASSALDVHVDRALEDGVRVFIAAGGDGTVHALVNAIVGARPAVRLDEISVGAVGLGSSNDFHKPYRSAVDGIPVRLGAPSPRDIARARYVDERGIMRERLFVVSASLGVTAAANVLFNDGDAFLRTVKAGWTGGAIAYAALQAIVRHRGFGATLRMGTSGRRTEIANVSVMKTPYLSGCLRYDTPVAPANGLLTVNICECMRRLTLLRTLASLARGRFRGRPGTHYWMVPELEIVPDGNVDLEVDGEVLRASSVRFDLLPERIGVCG